jgi:hypothetical protein
MMKTRVKPSSSQLHAQFNRASISEKDFAEAEECLRAYGTTTATLHKKALLIAAVIAYARPFKDSDTSDVCTAHLPAAAIKDFTAEEKRYHAHLLSVRDEAIAHSGFARKAVRRVSGSGTGFVTTGRIFDVRAEIEQVSRFLSIVLKLSTYCRNVMFALNAKLTEHDPQ